MPNTVFGPYSPTTWVDNVTQGNHATLNNLESQASVALNGFNGDLLTALVLSGMVCTKDGTTANQLDVTAGRAYTTMSDGTLGLIVTAASTAAQFTTSTPSTTYYLFLLNTGAWQWSTTSTGPANSLAICQATTDASSNILAVTDKRPLNTTLLPSMLGTLSVPPLSVGGSGVILSTSGAAGNTDQIVLKRTAGTAQAVNIGLDVTGALYFFDVDNAAFIMSGLRSNTPIQTTRYNGTTGVGTAVAVYTGYTGGANPSNPPTGSIRIDA